MSKAKEKHCNIFVTVFLSCGVNRLCVVAFSQSIRGKFLHVLLSENHKLQRSPKVKF